MNFSALTDGFAVPTNRLYEEREALKSQGITITDMVSGQGASGARPFPARALQQALKTGVRATLPYRPDPRGQRVARKAISQFYESEGLSVPIDSIVLTPGTSLSYWYLFKLLANAGDQILSPQPSYPLFESIARMSDVTLVPYTLREEHDWSVDLAQLESSITPRTRAILLISPHNPTGAVIDPQTLMTLADIATRHQLAIIADEVFSSFLLDAETCPRIAQTHAPLVFTLNGFSKMFALPGLKIGWIAVTGNPELVHQSLARLEMISDLFLPVQEAAQGSVPSIFSEGKKFLSGYQSYVKSCSVRCVQGLASAQGVVGVAPHGGFYMTVQLKNRDEEHVCLTLLKSHHLLVHPGYFYDLPGSHLVFSFVQPKKVLDRFLKVLQEEETT